VERRWRRGRLQYMAERLQAIAAEKERLQKAEEEEMRAGGGGGAHDVDDAASDWSRSQVLPPARCRFFSATGGGGVCRLI
jgi:hypothetical protein